MHIGTEDRDLLFLLTTTGIRFLDHTYEALTGPEGFSLRILDKELRLAYFELTGTAESTVAQLKFELEHALYDHILGRPNSRDTNWTIKG